MDDKELRRIKQNEYNRRWRNKNKDKTKQLYQEYYSKNKDKIILKSKIWYQNNKNEKLNYNKHNKVKSYKCRKNRTIKLQQFIIEYKINNKCIKCNENRPECLDFHHIKDKKNTISRMCKQTVSLKILKIEIEKCILLCSNCHQKEHFKGYKKISKRKSYEIQIKSKSKCYFCEENTPCALAFHHLDPATKIDTVDRISNSKGFTLIDLKNEIEKCIILCFNCHRLLHANQLSLPEDIQPIKLDI